MGGILGFDWPAMLAVAPAFKLEPETVAQLLPSLEHPLILEKNKRDQLDDGDDDAKEA